MVNAPTDAPWIKHILYRIKRNKNWLCLISGPTGSGKSYSALSIATMLDKNFNADRVVFWAQELLSLVNSGKLPERKGNVILWDDCAVGLSNKTWQSIANRSINFLLQTFRHRCFILIFTAPRFSLIDASTRGLFHAEFRTVSIDRKRKTVKIKPFGIEYGPTKPEPYRKYMRIYNKKEFSFTPMIRWNIPKPPQDLITKYEIKKTEFTNLLNQSIQRDLEKVSPLRPKIYVTCEYCDKKFTSQGIIAHQRLAHPIEWVKSRESRL